MVEFSELNVAAAAWGGYTAPITRPSQAASTTPGVTMDRRFTRRIRSTCESRRWIGRKLPPLIRMTDVAILPTRVAKFGEAFELRGDQERARLTHCDSA